MLVKKDMPRKLRGFTLTEAAIVLGIVGLLLGAIWVAAAAVYNNMRISTTTTQILQIAQAVRAMHATTTSITTGGDLAPTLAQAGAIPKDMMDNAIPPSITNVWGGAVRITATTAAVGGTPAQQAFTITYEGVPTAACSDLLVRNTGSGRDSGLLQAGAGGNNTPAANMPIQVTSAVQQCGVAGQGGGGVGNNVAFTFTLRV